MAIAGKVAIVPKGAWNSTTNYEKLNAVTYNNKLFIAKKASIGVEPEDGDTWMFGVQSLDQEQFDELSSELDELSSALDQLENDKADKSEVCVNLLKPTRETVTTINGVTCTNNGDGTYTLNGTANANTQFEIKARGVISKQIRLVGCPMGGSNTSYNIVVVNYNGSNIRDNGNGIIIPTNTECAIRIYVESGTTLSNKVFKPMLTTDLSAIYDDFVPYTGDNERLNEDVAELTSDLSALQSKVTGLFSLDGTTLTITTE